MAYAMFAFVYNLLEVRTEPLDISSQLVPGLHP